MTDKIMVVINKVTGEKVEGIEADVNKKLIEWIMGGRVADELEYMSKERYEARELAKLPKYTREGNIVTFKSGWCKEPVRMNVEGLTDNEIEVMRGIRTNCFSDIYVSDCGDWSFGVCDECTFDEKVYRGVASSLVKKGLVKIWDTEGKGRFKDMSIELTPAGKAIYL